MLYCVIPNCARHVCVCSQIDKKLMQASNMIERVRKEVEIHSRLKHPSILEVCTLHDAKFSIL